MPHTEDGAQQLAGTAHSDSDPEYGDIRSFSEHHFQVSHMNIRVGGLSRVRLHSQFRQGPA